MPYVLPRSVSSQHTALVLAFGKLSLLEACTLMKGGIPKLETPCERVGVVEAGNQALLQLPKLAGLHKAGALLSVVDGTAPDPAGLVEAISEPMERLHNLSLSGYELGEDDYESLVRALLDSLKDAGFRKIHLIRPKGNELRADEVLSRRALDIIAFPYREGVALAPTTWVSDASKMRERGLRRPAPNSEISMSPRLASLLVNLSGVAPGGTVLDPFCGSGTILSEALLHRARCLGLDSSERRVRDSRRNLSWMASNIRGATFNVRVGDARDIREAIGERQVDSIVTEPLLLPTFQARPKADTATALMESIGGTYAQSLASMAEAVKPGGRIVVVVPTLLTMEGKEVSITLEGRRLGLKTYQPGPANFEYPVKPSFESTRWVRRGVYVFESAG